MLVYVFETCQVKRCQVTEWIDGWTIQGLCKQTVYRRSAKGNFKIRQCLLGSTHYRLWRCESSKIGILNDGYMVVFGACPRGLTGVWMHPMLKVFTMRVFYDAKLDFVVLVHRLVRLNDPLVAPLFRICSPPVTASYLFATGPIMNLCGITV